MSGPSETMPFTPPSPDDPHPFANPGDQPEPPDAAARGLTRRKVRHVATGETWHIWWSPWVMPSAGSPAPTPAT